jgi:hypothetical protein
VSVVGFGGSKLEAGRGPPTPRSNLYQSQKKGVVKKAVCKLLKTKGENARGASQRRIWRLEAGG